MHWREVIKQNRLIRRYVLKLENLEGEVQNAVNTEVIP
jgi:hypothetical protein